MKIEESYHTIGDLTVCVTNKLIDERCLVVVTGGFVDFDIDWAGYLEKQDKYNKREHFDLIRHAIIALNWVGKTGSEIADDYNFCFSDSTVIGFTWRAWGDLMSVIIGKNEGYPTYI